MSQNKKRFLRLYLLQQKKINRLKNTMNSNHKKTKDCLIQIAQCEEVRRNIERLILSVDDEILKELLIQKYMCGKTLEEISLILNYSLRHTERLHAAALKKLDI